MPTAAIAVSQYGGIMRRFVHALAVVLVCLAGAFADSDGCFCTGPGYVAFETVPQLIQRASRPGTAAVRHSFKLFEGVFVEPVH
jgi:hypothetical protein